MDPLSLSLGIAGIVPLIAKLIHSARQYVTTVSKARAMIAALVAELEALQSIVDNLNSLLKSDSLSSAGTEFDQTSVLMSCFTACEANLIKLYEKLSDESNSRIGRYLWPFNEKEHQKTLAEIRSFAIWIQFALSVDGCRLLSHTSDNVVTVLSQQLEQFEAVQRVEDMTTELCTAMQNHNKAHQDHTESQHRKEVLDWISTATPVTRHSIIQRSRAKNTGNWLLSSQDYTAWKDGTASSVLWCSGIQGSGKTVLASTVVDDLLVAFAGANSPVAFFYFDHQEHESQTPVSFARCILRQLLEHVPALPPSVGELYEARGTSPALFDCERIIREISDGSESTYVVIDALDECNSKHLKPILQLIDRLSQMSTCRLLVTSRPYVCELAPAFDSYSEVKIEAHVEDIRTYANEECNASSVCDMADQPFVDALVEKLAHGAHGMFLLSVLQLRAVLSEPTIGEMEDRLAQLSDGLSDAFEDTLSRIRRLPENRSRLALSVLMHLAHAKRLLKVDELSDILALKKGQKSINPKYRPMAKMILECCQGLVMVDQGSGRIRLAHYAIHEYLVANAEKIYPGIKVRLALDCLNYLRLEPFASGPEHTARAIKSRLESHPFLGYAARHMGGYVRDVETRPEVWKALVEFYATIAATASAVQGMRFATGYRKEYFNAAECLSFTPLHGVAWHGLSHMVKALLDSGAVTANERTEMGSTPIIHAASKGHVSTVQLLLDYGADPRLGNWYGDALQCAAEAGQIDTIRQLVRWGMDPDGKDSRSGRPPLSCALDRDSVAAFELLVDLGADINLPLHHDDDDDDDDGDDENDDDVVFHLACFRGCDKIVSLMLRRGWVDVGSNAVESVLGTAPLPILRTLINAGVDVNAADEDGRTAIWHQDDAGNYAAVRALLDAGATPCEKMKFERMEDDWIVTEHTPSDT